MLEIARIDNTHVKELAPLAAQFRVTLKSFKGISAGPDAEAAAEELREYLSSGFPVFAAKAAGEYRGYIVCRVDEPCVWVESIYVVPSARRQGVAGALFREAEKLAAAYGEDTVYNYVHPNNSAMIGFLKARGYSVLNLIEIRRPYAGEQLSGKIGVGENQFDY